MRTIKLFLAAALFVCPLFAQTDPLWDKLKDGNTVFQGDAIAFRGLKDLRQDLYDNGQKPPYAILACSDSRVPPELVFHQKLGQLFVVRSAGNVADTFAIASLEYALSQPEWKTAMIVVLAHEGCGAVEAALDTKKPAGSPSLLALVTRIRESFGGIAKWDPNDPEAATFANARQSAAQLVANSQIIRDAVQSGRVKLVVAYYYLKEGPVRRLN